MIILIILIIVLLLSFLFINKTLKNKNIKLDNNNKINENTINKKQFSMYVENDNGKYEEYTSSNMFPEGYNLNLEKSKCVDNKGLEVKNILSGNGNKVTVTSNKTVFCYVYFDKKKILSDYLIENVSSAELWNSPLEGDGYRYVGTNPDNYICFGTTDKDTCVNDTDKYMYRIIGIFEGEAGNKHAKLIKKEALNKSYAWYCAPDWNDIDWNNSSLYKGINGSYFLTNEEYSYMQDTTWTDKIATWNYTMTSTKSYENYTNNSIYGPYYNENTAKIIYLHELNRNSKANEICYYDSGTSPIISDCNLGEWNTLNTKISLMYVSDYALSLGETALNYIAINDYDAMKEGWIHLLKNDSNPPYYWEWTMTLDGPENSRNYAYRIDAPGDVHPDSLCERFSARPVFYLESDVELSTNSGDGSETNPFLPS